MLCFRRVEEGGGQGCPVRAAGDECLSVIGRTARLSLSIHAGHSGLGGLWDILPSVSEDVSAVEPPPDKTPRPPGGDVASSC